MKKSIFANLTVSATRSLATFFLIASPVFAGSVDTVDARSDGEGCYNYLTELVRSSDFPFRYTTKNKINLIIDDDNGERILAQLRYKTSGEGIVGWVKYYIQDKALFNASADLEEPVRLNYDKKYAELYAKCTSRLEGGKK
ncbi:hypothetical protein [Pseudomonas sp. EA_65y_Pfl1_P120]|uniref:hypothetical protein n=1 Tax=Pseudomonas sp. EA_65y_Pfl1_P120 TaxID=3088693 RepID=UPI0030DC3D1D